MFQIGTPDQSEPWFVGKDVAEVLGYSDTKSALADHVDREDRQIIQKGQIATLDIPNRGMTIIKESGLYCLILRRWSGVPRQDSTLRSTEPSKVVKHDLSRSAGGFSSGCNEEASELKG